MQRQKTWDIYEAAILLDALCDVYDGKISRKDAIISVSQTLRNRAILSGLEIDDVYRNVAGITFQMHSMESAYVGYTVVKPASKLFLSVVKMMRENKAEFEKVLREALRMTSEDKSIEEKFMLWLSPQVTDAQLEELKVAYSQIDEFCLNRRILKEHLFNTTDLIILADVERNIDGNKTFWNKYKRSINKMYAAIHYYLLFIREEMENSPHEKTTENIALEEEISKEITKEEEVAEPIVDKQVIAESEHSFSEEIEKRKNDFADWMIKKGMASATVRPYVSSLNIAGEIALRNNVISTSIFSISDAEILKTALTELKVNSEFIEKNETRHNQLRAVWKKYIDYIEETSGEYEVDTSSTVEDLIKREYPIIYMRLKSMSKVYDNAKRVELNWIRMLLGVSIEKQELIRIIDGLPWITRVEEGVYSFSLDEHPKEKDLEFDKDEFTKVLLLRYPNGMRFDSIDLENYREAYQDIVGEDINFTDKELELCLRKCGIMFQGRIFPAEGIVSNDAREKLMAYINSNFINGKKVLYYKSILSDLSDDLASCYNLTDYKMLKPYLEYTCEPGEFYYKDEYMSKERNVVIDHSSEIKEYMLLMRKPLSYDEIYLGLSHISKDIIYSEIKSNPNYLLNEKEHYYHYDIFELSYEEADMITDFIKDEIEEEGYCIWSRVYKRISTELPLFVENNACLSSLGIRNGLSKKLSGRFSFDGEVISSREEPLNMSAVFRIYGERHAPFTENDIYTFSKEINGGVTYFDSLSETTIRVSKDLFVHKTEISFDIPATDEAIETFFSSDYVLIKDFDSFLVFPTVNYEWNVFLLESYLLFYSENFALVNNGRSLGNVAGAVAKRGSAFDDFESVCVDVLANSDCTLSQNKALDYLADINLLTRRKYSKIENVILKAKQIRNEKGIN